MLCPIKLLARVTSGTIKLSPLYLKYSALRASKQIIFKFVKLFLWFILLICVIVHFNPIIAAKRQLF